MPDRYHSFDGYRLILAHRTKSILKISLPHHKHKKLRINDKKNMRKKSRNLGWISVGSDGGSTIRTNNNNKWITKFAFLLDSFLHTRFANGNPCRGEISNKQAHILRVSKRMQSLCVCYRLLHMCEKFQNEDIYFRALVHDSIKVCGCDDGRHCLNKMTVIAAYINIIVMIIII